MECWILYSHQCPAPEAPLAPGYTAAAASQRTAKDDPVSDRLTHPPYPSFLEDWLKKNVTIVTQHGSPMREILLPPLPTPPHPRLPVSSSSLLPPTPNKLVHSTILASVLISARTQSGQSRSPQNRNLCKRVRWEVRLQKGLRCAQDPCSGCALSGDLFSLSPDCLGCCSLPARMPPDLVLTFTLSAQQASTDGRPAMLQPNSLLYAT